ncbi:MAG: glutathione S-transferase family protein [Nevskiaceae bacterium]|nr:MAG: glutathione S-transferase family protein [Nevskiaceae bacterium]
MSAIVLHQWEMSPFCNKVRRCLRHKGLDYSVVNYNGLLALNAAKLSAVGQLPVVDFNGVRVQDSSAIAHYLDAHYPDKPLYPHEPRALAEARLWEDWAAQSLYFYEIYFRMLDPVSLERGLNLISEGRPAYERALLKFVFKRRYPRKLKEQGLARMPREQVEAQFFARLDDIDTLLEGRAYLGGDAPNIADFSVVGQLDELIRTSDLKGRILAYPRLAAWLARC